MAGVFMIAVTGGSGSGKTTLSRALHNRLGAARSALVTEDNYYLPRDKHTPSVVGWSNDEIEKTINFDDPASKEMPLFREHLVQLRGGQAIDQPVYDFAIHDRVPGAMHRIDARPVVIVEGVHVLAKRDFHPLFDLTVFVDTSDDLRLIRRIRRDRAERDRPSERVIQQYLRFVRASYMRYTHPAKFVCDIVVADEGAPAFTNDVPDAMAVERLVAPVWSRMTSLGVVGTGAD